MTDRTDTLPPPLGWFESPHGSFRANPHLRVQFPSSSLEWQIGVHDEPTVRRLLAERDALIHDIEGYVQAASEQAADILRLAAERDALRAKLDALLREAHDALHTLDNRCEPSEQDRHIAETLQARIRAALGDTDGR